MQHTQYQWQEHHSEKQQYQSTGVFITMRKLGEIIQQADPAFEIFRKRREVVIEEAKKEKRQREIEGEARRKQNLLSAYNNVINQIAKRYAGRHFLWYEGIFRMRRMSIWFENIFQIRNTCLINPDMERRILKFYPYVMQDVTLWHELRNTSSDLEKLVNDESLNCRDIYMFLCNSSGFKALSKWNAANTKSCEPELEEFQQSVRVFLSVYHDADRFQHYGWTPDSLPLRRVQVSGSSPQQSEASRVPRDT